VTSTFANSKAQGVRPKGRAVWRWQRQVARRLGVPGPLHGGGDLAVADVNGDGRLDLAVGSNNWVALLLADATGLRPAQYVENSQNRDVVWLVDLTGDGRPDLLTAQTNASQVLVNRFVATDGLQPSRFVSAGTNPTVVETTDCNPQDSLSDVLVASTNAVRLLMGQASPTLLVTTNTLTLASTPTALATADFDNDGMVDLALAGAGGVSVHRATSGQCTWFSAALPTSLPLSSSPAGLVAADFNRDGWADLATANLTGGVSVALGADGGAFFGFDSYATGMSTRAIVAAQLNGDLFPDLAVVNEGSNNVSVLLNAGDGGFLPAAPYATGLTPWALASGDFNGDGVVDLATANSNSGNVSVLLGNGNGTFQAATGVATGMTPRGIRAADLTGDGHLDLVTSNVNGPNIVVLSGTGTGAFQNPVSLPLTNPTGRLAVGDFNGDGRVDVMTTTTSSGAVFRALCLP
jgi:hypothetical protein